MNLSVMKFSALGDIAQSLPVLRALKFSPTIITSPLGKELLKDEFDNFLLLSDKKISSVLKIILEIRKQKFDWIIDLQNNDRSFAISHLTNTHIANQKEIDLTQNIHTRLYQIAQKSSAINPIDMTYITREKTYIVLNCGSSPQWASKRLPDFKWKEISSILYERYRLPFYLTGDIFEKEYIEHVSNFIVGQKEVIAGKTTLQDLKKILTKAFLTVSTDSGPLHLSSVQKTPTIGLFGASNWVKAAPFGPWSTTLFDPIYYPNAIPPHKSYQTIDNFYDNIDITSALKTLQPYLL